MRQFLVDDVSTATVRVGVIDAVAASGAAAAALAVGGRVVEVEDDAIAAETLAQTVRCPLHCVGGGDVANTAAVGQRVDVCARVRRT